MNTACSLLQSCLDRVVDTQKQKGPFPRAFRKFWCWSQQIQILSISVFERLPSSDSNVQRVLSPWRLRQGSAM